MLGECGTELKPGQLVAFMTQADLRIGKIERLTAQMVRIFDRQKVWDQGTRRYTGTFTYSAYARLVKPNHVAVILQEAPDLAPGNQPPPGAGALLT